jgi:toxin ParE1/3/4
VAEINWTAEAERWLRDIYDYISQDKPIAAANVVSGIYAKPNFYAIFQRSDICIAKKPTILLYGHYRIAYLIKSSERIDILGVFHGSLDIVDFYYELQPE